MYGGAYRFSCVGRINTNVTLFESYCRGDEEALAGYVYLSNSNGDVFQWVTHWIDRSLCCNERQWLVVGGDCYWCFLFLCLSQNNRNVLKWTKIVQNVSPIEKNKKEEDTKEQKSKFIKNFDPLPR